MLVCRVTNETHSYPNEHPLQCWNVQNVLRYATKVFYQNMYKYSLEVFNVLLPTCCLFVLQGQPVDLFQCQVILVILYSDPLSIKLSTLTMQWKDKGRAYLSTASSHYLLRLILDCIELSKSTDILIIRIMPYIYDSWTRGRILT